MTEIKGFALTYQDSLERLGLNQFQNRCHRVGAMAGAGAALRSTAGTVLVESGEFGLAARCCEAGTVATSASSGL